MSKKRYESPTLLEFGTLDALTRALAPAGFMPAQIISVIFSDQNLKEQFAPVDPQTILNRISELPISTWNYRADGQQIRHIGPMAQDFAALFGVGHDNKHIDIVDANGIAFAAIQGLYQKLQEKDAQIAELRAEIDALKGQVR